MFSSNLLFYFMGLFIRCVDNGDRLRRIVNDNIMMIMVKKKKINKNKKIIILINL